MSVKENIAFITSTLPQHVTLIAVSKTKPNDLILEAYNAGQREFGENYVQELVDKHEQLPKDIRWHFIGHLQSNKVKYIAPFVHLIHGVDSYSLLKEINKQALKNNRVIDCLLQIYIAKEESKFGLDAFEAEQLLISHEFNELENINIVGLMGMATNTSDEKIIANEFESLNTLFKYLKSTFGNKHNLNLTTISMGMSSDYNIAITHGSTMIRVGSSIFGERNYVK
jgi:PLP dependent protein